MEVRVSSYIGETSVKWGTGKITYDLLDSKSNMSLKKVEEDIHLLLPHPDDYIKYYEFFMVDFSEEYNPTEGGLKLKNIMKDITVIWLQYWKEFISFTKAEERYLRHISGFERSMVTILLPKFVELVDIWWELDEKIYFEYRNLERKEVW